MRGTLRDGRLNLYDLTLRCGENLKWRSGLLQTCLDGLEYAIYGFIISERGMVGQSDSLYTRVLPNLNRVFDWAMPPPNFGRILLGGVLRIVDKKIRVIGEGGISLILSRDFRSTCCHYGRMGFVITAIHDGYPIGFHAITQRERRMI